jgi:MazG family protein
MNRLLAPDGCPWDREQTLASLKPYLLEEAHEVLEALESGDAQHHREELGDLLFQIVFQSALREREGAFDIDQVCTALVDKMKRRHPHVFGDLTVKDSGEVLANWGAIKAAEKKAAGKTEKRGTLDGIPQGLPALLRAQRLGEKAASVGFDWPDLDGVRDKLKEELGELDEALHDGEPAAIVHELGDVLFTLTRLCSKLGHPPEDVLRAANARFVRRFSTMEAAAEADGHPLKGLSLDQMNAYWDRAKT